MNQKVLEFSSDLAFAWSDSHPTASAEFRTKPEDFCVDEDLGFEPSGVGEHVYLHLEKTGQNTQWVLDQIAEQLGIERSLFGYAGLKDRHAKTTQWVSIQSPKRDISMDEIQVTGVQVLGARRHPTKLRPGMHVGNRFQILLRQLTGQASEIEPILAEIKNRGFPNYFGEQRFGFDNQNLERGWSLLRARKLGRHKKKGIYLSALRSFLFNQVLTRWLCETKEKPAKFVGFKNTGPLWGRGRAPVGESQIAYEKKLLEPWVELCAAIEHVGLNQERRELMVVPRDLSWIWREEDQLQLEFFLPPGSYATSLLRELGEMKDVSKIALEA